MLCTWWCYSEIILKPLELLTLSLDIQQKCLTMVGRHNYWQTFDNYRKPQLLNGLTTLIHCNPSNIRAIKIIYFIASPMYKSCQRIKCWVLMKNGIQVDALQRYKRLSLLVKNFTHRKKRFTVRKIKEKATVIAKKHGVLHWKKVLCCILLLSWFVCA